MPTITTAELIERAMAAADMHDSFVTPRQWMYWASQERIALDLFIARSGWTQGFETVTITVTGAEAGSFVLTPSIQAIVAVHQISTQGVRRLKFSDVASFLLVQPGGTAMGNASEWRAKRTDTVFTLNLYPEPKPNEQYLVTYLPHPTRLTLDSAPAVGYSNTVAYPMGWEDRIVLGMARRALEKEESDSGAIRGQMAEMDRQIEQACWDMSTSDGPTVIGTDIERRGWIDRLSYPRPFAWWWAP